MVPTMWLGLKAGVAKKRSPLVRRESEPRERQVFFTYLGTSYA